MGFIKSPEEYSKSHLNYAKFYDAEMLNIFFLTTPEVTQKLIPPPLKPSPMPVASAFVAYYPKTEIGITYRESALFLEAEFNGELGYYCLAMTVTDDMALILGRESLGYPKKMADIHFKRQGTEVEGWSERHGFRFFDVRAKLTGRFNDMVAQEMMKDQFQAKADFVIFNYKYFQSPTGEGFDYNPRLIKERIAGSRKTLDLGEAEILLRSSPTDPWGDVVVTKVLGALYSVQNMTLLPGKVVAEIDQKEFMPYSFMNLDPPKALMDNV